MIPFFASVRGDGENVIALYSKVRNTNFTENEIAPKKLKWARRVGCC